LPKVNYYSNLKKLLVLFCCIYGNSLSFAQTPKGINLKSYETFQAFENELYTESDSTYILNFWATWCKPCVAELPYFEQLHEEYEGTTTKVVLVSLDFKRQINKKLIPFMINKRIKSDVISLTDSKTTKWIDLVDESWSGALPATLIFNKDKRLFLEQEFSDYEELKETIHSFLKP